MLLIEMESILRLALTSEMDHHHLFMSLCVFKWNWLVDSPTMNKIGI